MSRSVPLTLKCSSVFVYSVTFIFAYTYLRYKIWIRYCYSFLLVYRKKFLQFDVYHGEMYYWNGCSSTPQSFNQIHSSSIKTLFLAYVSLEHEIRDASFKGFRLGATLEQNDPMVRNNDGKIIRLSQRMRIYYPKYTLNYKLKIGHFNTFSF